MIFRFVYPQTFLWLPLILTATLTRLRVWKVFIRDPLLLVRSAEEVTGQKPEREQERKMRCVVLFNVPSNLSGGLNANLAGIWQLILWRMYPVFLWFTAGFGQDKAKVKNFLVSTYISKIIYYSVTQRTCVCGGVPWHRLNYLSLVCIGSYEQQCLKKTKKWKFAHQQRLIQMWN